MNVLFLTLAVIAFPIFVLGLTLICSRLRQQLVKLPWLALNATLYSESIAFGISIALLIVALSGWLDIFSLLVYVAVIAYASWHLAHASVKSRVSKFLNGLLNIARRKR
jgi:hypothetical protein